MGVGKATLPFATANFLASAESTVLTSLSELPYIPPTVSREMDSMEP